MSRDNSGSLGPNERKEKDTHPDLKGKCVIGGKEYWISGWKKENEKGKWLSLAFEPKVDKPDARPAPRAPQRSTREDDAW